MQHLQVISSRPFREAPSASTLMLQLCQVSVSSFDDHLIIILPEANLRLPLSRHIILFIYQSSQRASSSESEPDLPYCPLGIGIGPKNLAPKNAGDLLNATYRCETKCLPIKQLLPIYGTPNSALIIVGLPLDNYQRYRTQPKSSSITIHVWNVAKMLKIQCGFCFVGYQGNKGYTTVNSAA